MKRPLSRFVSVMSAIYFSQLYATSLRAAKATVNPLRSPSKTKDKNVIIISYAHVRNRNTNVNIFTMFSRDFMWNYPA